MGGLIGGFSRRLGRGEGAGPAAVLLDDLIDLGHQADGLLESDDDLMIVGDVLVGEGAAFAVLQPLLADLIASDVKVPDRLEDTLEPCRLSLVDENRIIPEADLLDILRLGSYEDGSRCLQELGL